MHMHAHTYIITYADVFPAITPIIFREKQLLRDKLTCSRQ